MGGLSLHPEEPVTDSLLPGSWDFPQLHENKSKSEAGITDEWVGRGWSRRPTPSSLVSWSHFCTIARTQSSLCSELGGKKKSQLQTKSSPGPARPGSVGASPSLSKRGSRPRPPRASGQGAGCCGQDNHNHCSGLRIPGCIQPGGCGPVSTGGGGRGERRWDWHQEPSQGDTLAWLFQLSCLSPTRPKRGSMAKKVALE